MTDAELWWTRKPTTSEAPNTHYGARRGEYPRYYVRRERRSGELMWVMYYRPGGLKDLELNVWARSLRDAQRLCRDDLWRRIALGEIPGTVETGERSVVDRQPKRAAIGGNSRGV